MYSASLVSIFKRTCGRFSLSKSTRTKRKQEKRALFLCSGQHLAGGLIQYLTFVCIKVIPSCAPLGEYSINFHCCNSAVTLVVIKKTMKRVVNNGRSILYQGRIIRLDELEQTCCSSSGYASLVLRLAQDALCVQTNYPS